MNAKEGYQGLFEPGAGSIKVCRPTNRQTCFYPIEMALDPLGLTKHTSGVTSGQSSELTLQ